MSELILPALFMGMVWVATLFPIPADKTFEEIDNEIKNK